MFAFARVNGVMYQATIGFQFENRTGGTLSANYCHIPAPPSLEKQRPSGAWVFAYSVVELMCRTTPPFRLTNGATYRGRLDMVAGRPGTNVFPKFGPDSVPGVYRLRWTLRFSDDPDDKAAPIVVALSPPFKLVMHE